MAAKELPEYKEWETLVEQKRDHWQYYLNLYSYALQKPARSFLTSWMYPAWYQQRLLYRDYATAMQAIGEVKPDELQEFARLNNDPIISRTYRYFTTGFLQPYHFTNLPAAAMGFLITALAMRIRKPKVWYFVPGMLTYMACNGLESRFHQLRIGSVIDLAHWTAEKRKASVWLAEKKQTKASLPPIFDLEGQLINLVKSFKA